MDTAHEESPVSQSIVPDVQRNEDIQVVAAPAPKPKRKRRVLRIIGVIVFVLVVIASLPLTLRLAIRDSDSVDDSDILLSRIDIPKEQNGFFDLTAIDGVNEREYDTAGLASAKNLALVNNPDFEKNVILDPTNITALEHWSDAAQKAFIQDPAAEDPGAYSPKRMLPSLSRWRQASRLSLLMSLYLSAHGKEEEALDQAFMNTTIGQHLETSQDGTIMFLVGASIKDGGLRVIDHLIASTTLSAVQLAPYIVKLNTLKQNEISLASAFKYEYLNPQFLFGLVARGDTKALDEVYEEGTSVMTHHTIYFLPNKTLQLFADNTRVQIAEAQSPCWEDASNKNYERITSKMPSSYFDLLVTPNWVGINLSGVWYVSQRSVFAKKCNDQSLVAATQMLMAVKAYKTDHGVLPESAADLVPAYLPQIPTDPWSGKSIVYVPEKKIVYSIGENRIDDGGDNFSKQLSQYDDPWRVEPDQVLTIAF